MSKGSPVLQVRIPQYQLDLIDQAILSANEHASITAPESEPYDRSSWIRKAITEKLRHLERSRRRKETECSTSTSSTSTNPSTTPDTISDVPPISTPDLIDTLTAMDQL